LLTHIRRFDEVEGWAEQGAKSCAHWLTWRIGLDPGTAREKVRVARALGTLTKIDQAFATGNLSYAKVRAVTTGAQLERICRRFRAATSSPPTKPTWWSNPSSAPATQSPPSTRPAEAPPARARPMV
jgi:hypothetical protein